MADWADLGPVRYYLGVDLGQSADYTALSLVEKRGDDRLTCHLSVRHLKRFPLQTPYSDIVLALARMVDDAPLDTKIILDRTGVGAGVFDFFQAHELMRKRRGAVLGVNIHGGDAETHEGPLWRVPKRNLVAAVAVPLQTRRLKIPASLPEVPQLVRELEAFKVKIDPVTAHDSYSSWREADHDDIVLSLALACWAALHPVLNAKWGTSPHPRLG